jgi:hypothetical protein
MRPGTATESSEKVSAFCRLFSGGYKLFDEIARLSFVIWEIPEIVIKSENQGFRARLSCNRKVFGSIFMIPSLYGAGALDPVGEFPREVSKKEKD